MPQEEIEDQQTLDEETGIEAEEQQPAEEEFDRGALEAKVADKLRGLQDDDAGEPPVKEEEEAEEEEEDEGGQADQDEEDEEAAADGEGEDEDEPSDPNAPTLPGNYRRSLKAYGWTDDEINQNLRVLGPKFVETAQRIHDNRNAELATWAEAGRRNREQQGGSDGPKAGQTQDEQKGPQALTPVDVAKLKEKYGDDDLIDEIVGPVNQVVQSINDMLPKLQAGNQTAAQQAEIEAVAQQVDGFFGGESLKPYRELYGDGKNLTEEQFNRRNAVLDTAYDLIVGASSLRGQKLSLEEALQNAHDIVARDFRDKAVRSTIQKEAKRRNRGLTVKPTRRAQQETPASGGQPRTRRELEAKVSGKLREVFGQ